MANKKKMLRVLITMSNGEKIVLCGPGPNGYNNSDNIIPNISKIGILPITDLPDGLSFHEAPEILGDIAVDSKTIN